MWESAAFRIFPNSIVLHHGLFVPIHGFDTIHCLWAHSEWQKHASWRYRVDVSLKTSHGGKVEQCRRETLFLLSIFLTHRFPPSCFWYHLICGQIYTPFDHCTVATPEDFFDGAYYTFRFAFPLELKMCCSQNSVPKNRIIIVTRFSLRKFNWIHGSEWLKLPVFCLMGVEVA